jgi:hypothetical protein
MRDIKHLFDYGDITEEHKEAAEEIANILSREGHANLADQIKSRFKVEEVPTYNLEESEFMKYCKEAGIFISLQGWIKDLGGDDTLQYPLCALNEDIRVLNKLVETIKKDASKQS